MVVFERTRIQFLKIRKEMKFHSFLFMKPWNYWLEHEDQKWTNNNGTETSKRWWCSQAKCFWRLHVCTTLEIGMKESVNCQSVVRGWTFQTANSVTSCVPITFSDHWSCQLDRWWNIYYVNAKLSDPNPMKTNDLGWDIQWKNTSKND